MNRRYHCALMALLLLGWALALQDASGDSRPYPDAPAAKSSGENALPRTLSEARFFASGSSLDPRPELLAFEPQYPLWSDGTTKRRWIELPAGTTIDARDPDAWEFPPGTRFYKEFALGRRIETRMIERAGDGSWRFGTYVWNDDESDADLAPSGGIRSLFVDGAPSGRYAIPSESDCRACHEGGRVPVLGFSALQLSPDRDPLAPHAAHAAAIDLSALIAAGVLRNLPPELQEHPPRIAARSPIERAALGYLHANCGHCHVASTDADSAIPVAVRLAQQVGEATSSADVLRTLLDVPTRYRAQSTISHKAVSDELTRAVVPGDPERSVLVLRMRSRDPLAQMPPLGTVVPDSTGLALIERWILERSNESPPLIEEQLP